MNFEEILIRMGIDAKAVTSGLQRVGSFVKGWATGLAHDLQHHIIGQFAGLYVFEKMFEMFEKIGEKAMFLRRLSKETGLGTNFLQGTANELGFVGESFEKLEKPLGKLNALIGQAKLGVIEARQKLIDWGIVAKGESFGSLNMSKAIASISEQFEKLGSHEEKAALLFQIFGKGYQSMFPIFELGSKKIQEMNNGNFFTKLSPMTIETFAQTMRSGKSAFNVASSVGGNIAGGILALNPVILLSRLKELAQLQLEAKKVASAGQIEEFFQTGRIEGMSREKELAHETTDEFIDRLKVSQELNEQQRLNNQLLDRGKSTVDSLANRAREIIGDKRPRGLNALHAISPAMASALRIQTLEDQEQIANALGRFDVAGKLQSQADSLRKNNLSLRSTERDPMEMIREKLDIITQGLERIGIEGLKVHPDNH